MESAYNGEPLTVAIHIGEVGNTVGSRLAREIDPVTTVACTTVAVRALHRQIYDCHNTPTPRLKKQGEEIVCAAGNSRERAMSARRILGLESVPRVGLFAH